MSVSFIDLESPAASYAGSIMGYVISVATNAVTETLQMTDAMSAIPIAEVEAVVLPDQITTEIDFNLAYQALQDILGNIPEDPSFGSVEQNTPDVPTIDDAPELSSVTIDEFTTEAPTLEMPTVPVFPDYVVPSSPEVNIANAPERPAFTLPEVPTISDVLIPEALGVEIPTFDETFIEEDLLAPSTAFNFNEVEYTSTLKTAVQAGLLEDIQNGDYGLDANDEQLLFDRGRDREAQGTAAIIQETTENMAGMGFVMPPGILGRAIERARQDYNNKVSSINRELTLKRADLYANFKQFTYAQAITLETVLISAHNQMMDRALAAAKAQVEMAVAVFNAEVLRYNAKLERYKVMAQVFESRIRAEIAKVEIFKAQIEAAKAQIGLQASRVDLYRARIEGVKTLIEAYKTDVEATSILANMERIRVEIYRAEVEAFVATISAKKVEFDAYEARIRGEVAKVQAYGEQAKAYAATIEGKKAQVEVGRLKLAEYAERNKAILEIYAARIEQGKDIRDAQKIQIMADIEAYKARVSAFEAESNALAKAYDLGQSAMEKQYRSQVLALQANTEIAKTELARVIKIAEISVEAFKSRGDTYRALAASALNALNVNAGLSDSYSLGKHSSESNSWSYSHNRNVHVDGGEGQ